MPAWIRSSSSTLAGNLTIIWLAMRRTSGAYVAISSDLVLRPVAVYISMPAFDASFMLRLNKPIRPRVRWRQASESLSTLTLLAPIHLPAVPVPAPT